MNVKKTWLVALLMSVALACGGDNDGTSKEGDNESGIPGEGSGEDDQAPGNNGDGASHNATGEFTDFDPVTRSSWRQSQSYSEYGWRLAFSDVDSIIACNAVEDPDNGLGEQARQVLIELLNESGTCPAGNYAVPSDCGDTPQENLNITRTCAYYREWNSEGKLSYTEPAVAGAVAVTWDLYEQECLATVDLRFSGKAFAYSFELASLGEQFWCE